MVWSKAKGCYVVVSELAKQNGKNKYGQTGDTTGLLSALLCALMLTGSALFWPMEVSAGTQYGDGTWADGYNTAIGIAATARGDGALALGTQTKATSIRSTAIGHQAEASGADSISIGTLSGASNTHSIAIGDKARGIRNRCHSTRCFCKCNANQFDGNWQECTLNGSRVSSGRY